MGKIGGNREKSREIGKNLAALTEIGKIGEKKFIKIRLNMSKNAFLSVSLRFPIFKKIANSLQVPALVITANEHNGR